MKGVAQRPFQRLKCRRRFVITRDIAQLRLQSCKHRLVHRADLRRDAIVRSLSELLDVPIVKRDPDHRFAQMAAGNHPVERGKDHLVGEVAGRPEHHESQTALRRLARSWPFPQTTAATPKATTVRAMTAAAIQPRIRNTEGIVNAPMMSLRCVITIIAIITGTATMPLITALQNRALMGSSGVKFRRAPITVAAAMVP